MTPFRLLTLAGSLALLAATSAAAQDAAPAPAQAPAAAPPAASAEPAAPALDAKGEVGAPEAGKGRIVFFRPSSMVGLVYSFKVREGETELGLINNGGYFIADVAPGKHTYDVHTTSKDKMNLDVDAGETYYVKFTMSMGLVAYTPNITPSNKAAFDKVASKLHQTSLK